MPVRLRVAGIRSSTTPSAGTPNWNELPKFPPALRIRNSPYCAGTGRSSPRERRMASYSAFVPCGLSRTAAGSPDSRRMTKTSVTTPQIATTDHTRRPAR